VLFRVLMELAGRAAAGESVADLGQISADSACSAAASGSISGSMTLSSFGRCHQFCASFSCYTSVNLCFDCCLWLL
jgi:hypothetical protein